MSGTVSQGQHALDYKFFFGLEMKVNFLNTGCVFKCSEETKSYCSGDVVKLGFRTDIIANLEILIALRILCCFNRCLWNSKLENLT